ncbi:MAG: SusC/RagA family TonB-linked outer membrane protein [Prevotellaceae bacterium]|jgi:TonB-linked SusC/RagA family outer membrane protein|nr:SusC/RagA family TonB-linked outer membrane protein [Prevotellaceae bacterium]
MKKHVWFLFFILLGGSAAYAQTPVTGVVTDDATGEPIPFVSVVVKGSTLSTITGDDGAFSIMAPATGVLQFSFLGYETKEMPVEGQKRLSVRLKPVSTVLDEIVVTGFQQVERRNFTGSSVKLKAEDMRTEGIVDVGRMLEGRAAGVSVQNVSGTFGAAPKIRVRGATSINGENKPLWVVDGVILEDMVNVSNDQLSSGDPMTLLGSAVAGLNASDIESFDILKDAAATALYGARAMNGVVVITTKRGAEGKPVIKYTGNYSVQLKPTYGEFNIMNSADQMSVLAELERKGWLDTGIINKSNWGVYGKMFNLLYFDEETGTFPLENTAEAKRAFLLRYAFANTDWFDLLFRNSFVQEHSLSFSSGSQNSKTYASIGFYNDSGWTVADDVNRYTMNFRNDYKVNNVLDVAVGATGSFRQQHTPGSQNRISNVVAGQYERAFDINPFSYALNTSRAMTLYDENGNLEYFTRNYAPFNIMDELEKNTMQLQVIDVKLQGEASAKITKDLRFSAIGAIRYMNTIREHMVEEGSNMAESYRMGYNSTIRGSNGNLYKDPDNPNEEPAVVMPYGGLYNRFDNTMWSYDVRGSFYYNKQLGESHKINAVAGMQVRSADRQEYSNNGFGYQYNSGGIVNLDYRIIKKETEAGRTYYKMSTTRDRGAAFYFNADYLFKERYAIAVTARYEGSNQLGAASSARWLPTWTVSGKWNIINEPFMENLRFINNLDIKASYGLVASMPPNLASAAATFYSRVTRRPLSTETEAALYLYSLANSELTWEKAYTFNIGFDVILFDNRVSLTAEYWKRDSYDLISSINTSGIGGEKSKMANYADLKGKGVDLTLGLTFIRNQDWTWRMNTIFGYATNEITRSEALPRIYDLVRPEGGNLSGYPVSSLFSVKYLGLNETGVPVFIDENNTIANTAYMQSTTTDYLQYEGPVDPPITGGINNTLQWKNLALNVFLSYQFGNKIRLYPAFKSSYSDMDALPKEFYDRWALPGEENAANIPSILDAFYYSNLGSAYPYNTYNYSSDRVASGNFIRLKSLSLSYNLPKTVAEKIAGIKGLSFTLTGNNLWLIYSDKKLKGQDPEFQISGGVAQPIQKQITLSLNVSF